MDERFGHTAIKEMYVTEAKLRKRKLEESVIHFRETIHNLYRKAYPYNPNIVDEIYIKDFLDKCKQSEYVCLAIKRLRHNILLWGKLI